MQTNLADFIRDTPEGREADAILRKCVHCGFCTATCPTYQLLGDELDGPRGRIYLIKQALEGNEVTAKTQLHLDRCLTCRACETTCPSGVQYGRLVDIGRKIVDERVPRSIGANAKRKAIATMFPQTALFGLMVKAGKLARPFLPDALANKLPKQIPAAGEWPAPRHARKMIALAGCVQPALDPAINAAAARVLDRLGISLVEAPDAGCCGALRFHLNFQEEGLADMRRLIDAWWPLVEEGAEAIVMTASGCTTTVKEYGYLLEHDPAYAAKAKRISEMTKDIAEVVAAEFSRLTRLLAAAPHHQAKRIAFHPPCSLQHGQQVRGVIEAILGGLGHELVPFAESHLCCGSAGTYSLLQPELAGQLRERKLGHLQAARPDLIATANIGCQSHLAAASGVPVVHWITLLENAASR